ncbi:hypothetical protein [Nocardioides sp.]|uniref:hypothetical protein n=1 Tax=Nocardioides sp. TaxID=35761 RepID=UPI003D117145
MTTDVLAPAPPEDAPAPRRRRRRWMAILAAILALGLSLMWWTSRAEDVRDGTELQTMQGLSATQGIVVDLIAVTAANGLVEFRFQVVDPDKATRILHETDLAPTLVDEATGATLRMSSPPHKHGGELRLGGTYFFLMANSHNTLHQGSLVTLVMGDSRVEHLAVQG